MQHQPVHDTSLVEQVVAGRQQRHDAALEHLRAADRRLDLEQQAQARRTTSVALIADLLAQGKRALMLGAAAALVILSVGLAIRLAQLPPAIETRLPQRPDAVVPPGRDDIIVSNYVLFTEAKRTIGGVDYTVWAGHRFLDERAEAYEAAWRYVGRYVNGVEIHLTLGNLTPDGQPTRAPTAVSDATRRAMGLSDAEATELFVACPWLGNGVGGGIETEAGLDGRPAWGAFANVNTFLL